MTLAPPALQEGPEAFPIGVFDSGVGGLSILRALRAQLPHEHFIYFADTGHAPYGERSEAFVIERSARIATQLVEAHAIKALVVACNTATAVAIHDLRERHPTLPIIGVEPALRPAASHTRTGRIAVLATRGTLSSAKFGALHASLKDRAEFVLQPCDGLAAAIEAANDDQIAALVDRHVRMAGVYGTATGEIDTVVLGCTHYPFAAAQIEARTAPGVRLIEPGEPVAAQTRRLLQARGALRRTRGDAGGAVVYVASGPDDSLREAHGRWLTHMP